VVRLAYVGINKLNTFIKVQKDKLPSVHFNVVYKINCQNYDASYQMGQTKRLLKTRIKEHQNHTTLCNNRT